MNIFFAIDQHYFKYLYIAICSILKNSAPEDQFYFFILHNHLSKMEKQKIENLKGIKNFKIEYISIDETSLLHCRREDYHLALTAFYRYLIPELRTKIDKAIYLDVDIVVKSSLFPLWKTDLQNYYLAAIPDKYYRFNEQYKDKIGLSKDSMYYNTGVLLLNLKKFRENRITEQLITKSIENIDLYEYGDQDALNIICKDKIKTVPYRYNMQGSCLKFIKTDAYMYQEYKKMVVRHFTGSNKRMLENIVYLKGFYGNQKMFNLRVKSVKPLLKKKIQEFVWKLRHFQSKV